MSNGVLDTRVMFTEEENLAEKIDFKSALNEEQYAAVTAGEGPSLVLAGAGSGKTRTLTYRVAYLLSKGIKPWNILLLTFTNKASKEMLGRVEDLTGIPKSQFWGGTFHSIGQRILRSHAEVIGLNSLFTILDEQDAEALLSDVIKQKDSEFLKSKENPKIKIVGDAISYARNTRQDVKKVMQERYSMFEHLTHKIDIFSKEYQVRKLRQNVVDFDDLLEHWLTILQKSPQAAKQYQDRFKYILVDEYQDTNVIQSKVIDQLAINHQVMAVGDDAQCIYTWRGANIENILTFSERHPGAVIHKIETNYRSTPEILKFANEVLKQQPANRGFYKELKSVKRSREKPFAVCTVDTLEQAGFVAKRIEGARREGKDYKDIAVLYRAHYQSMDLQMELTRRGIPFTITSGLKFFEQAHIRDVVGMLKFAWNSADTTAFMRTASLLPRVGGKTAEKLLKLTDHLAHENRISRIMALTDDSILKIVPEEAKDDWMDMVLTLQNLEEGMHPPYKADENLFKAQDSEEDLFSFFEAKNKQEAEEFKNIPSEPFIRKTPAQLVEIVIEGWYGDFIRHVYPNWEDRKQDLEGLMGFAYRFEDFSEFLTQIVLLNSETTEKTTDPDDNTVKLTTIHQAKGLEYPIVFVIGLGEGLFPLKRAVDEGNVEEERRLFYVAVTRAQEELYLTYPTLNSQGVNVFPIDSSRFIRELPSHLYQALHLQKSRMW